MPANIPISNTAEENITAIDFSVNAQRFKLAETKSNEVGVYIKGTNIFRTNLSNLVGRSLVLATPSNGEQSTTPGADFKKADFKKDNTIIENGSLVELKITKANTHEISFIVGKVSLDIKQMNEYLVSELYSLDINEQTDVDIDRLKKAYGQKLNPNTYLILGATVVEVLSKSFYEKDLKGETKILIASLGGAIGYNGRVYDQQSSFTRTWRIYLTLISVDAILQAYA